MRPGRGRLERRRVPLAGLGAGAVRSLRDQILTAAPSLSQGGVALVDSPRWPRDLDVSKAVPTRRPVVPKGRILDSAVRAIARTLGHSLSMYPTPPFSYFAACTSDHHCKPHLGAIARELFGNLLDDPTTTWDAPVRGGALFTRFMLAGFAAYRALEEAGVETLESYPELQFRIWSHTAIPPKKSREGIRARQQINAQLRTRLRIASVDAQTRDQADAEVLALGAAIAAREGKLLVLNDECEGRFLIASGTEQTRGATATAGKTCL